MKKKSVKLLLSLVVFAVAAGAYVYVKNSAFDDASEIEDAEENAKSEEIIDVDIDDIKKVSFMVEKNEATFLKSDDTWVLESDKEFPVDNSLIEEAIGKISSVKPERVLEDFSDLAEYQLDMPENTIVIETEEESISLKVGMLNDVVSQYYVLMNDDDSKVYMVAEATISPFMNKLYDYAQMTPFPDIESGNIDCLEVKTQESDLIVEKDETTSTWNISDDGQVDKADSAKATSFVSGVTSIEYESFVDYNCIDKNKYGLEEPFADVVVDYHEEIEEEETEETEEIEEEIEKETEIIERNLVLHIGDQNGNGARYVNINDSNEIYTISEDVLETFLDKKISDLWDLSVFDGTISNLSEMSVEYEGETKIYNVSRETSENEDGEEIENVLYMCDEKEIDETMFVTFYNKINNISAQKRLEEEYTLEGNPEISIKIKELDGEEVNLDFYSYDVNFYAAVREDKVYLINKLNVKELIAAYEELSEV